MDEQQVDEVSDTETMLSRYRMFYGDPDAAKCDDTMCNKYHLFSQ